MSFPSAFGFLPQKGQPTRVWVMVLSALVPIAFGFLATSLGQDGNWDLRNYHYYNAYAFLNNRYAQDLLPSQTPYFYNPLMDVPFFVLATLVSAKMAGFALGFLQGFNFILLFWIAHVVLIVPNPKYKVALCAFLAMLGMLGGGGIAQIGTTFGDNITSLGILLSVALIVRKIEYLSSDAVSRALKSAFIFGIPAGLMIGLKLPSAIYAVGLCGGLLFIGKDWRRGVVLSFGFGLGVLVGGVITFGPWAAFLYSHFGSPLFPYFNDFFQSPLAPLTSARDIQYAPHSWSDYFLMPFLFAKSAFRVGEIDLRDWRLPILYVLLPLVLLLRVFFFRRRQETDLPSERNAARYLLASFSLAYVVWLALFSIYRYAVTLEMVAPLLIVLTINMLPLKIKTRTIMAIFVLVTVAASIKPGDWGRREVWLDRFVEATVPDLSEPANLMVLMAGMEPYSHVIPEFPPEISFVRIQSNFSSPEENKGINKVLHDRVGAHRKKDGRFMLLIPFWQATGVDEALAAFGLKRAPEKCLEVTDRLFNDTPLSLCPLQ